MAKTQRMREVISASPTLEYLAQMHASGWRLVILEWEKETENEAPDALARVEEVPYGMQVADDHCHLVESPAEMRVLMAAVNFIVDDLSMSQVAEEMNLAGFRTRKGTRWTASNVFDLLPRMIEAGPRIFSRDDWNSRRRRLPAD